MDIVAATKQFEEWLAGAIPLIAADLRAKHRAMANEADPFPFMRATFYRWAQLWPEVCPDLARAPQVLAVGDLHIENFGTWRDREGRLVWGINDVDEAYPLPYAGEAGGGVDACTEAEELAPDIIIMDLSMPDLSGIDAMKRIHARRPDLPVVILTAHADEGVEREAREAGASGFLAKGTGLHDLVIVLHEAAEPDEA